MTNFKINGKERPMVVNLGTMLYAEGLNKGVDKELTHRLNLGFGLACFYGADPDCDLTMDDIISSITDITKYKEFLAAIQRESDIFNGINDDMPDVDDREDETPKKG